MNNYEEYEQELLSGYINPLEYIISNNGTIIDSEESFRNKQFCDKYYIFNTAFSNYHNVLQITFIKYEIGHTNGYCWDDALASYFEEEEHFVNIPQCFYGDRGILKCKLFYDKYLCNTEETRALFEEIEFPTCKCEKSYEVYSVKNILLL